MIILISEWCTGLVHVATIRPSDIGIDLKTKNPKGLNQKGQKPERPVSKRPITIKAR